MFRRLQQELRTFSAAQQDLILYDGGYRRDGIITAIYVYRGGGGGEVYKGTEADELFSIDWRKASHRCFTAVPHCG